MPILLYGHEACPMKKSDLNSLDFVVVLYEVVSDRRYQYREILPIIFPF